MKKKIMFEVTEEERTKLKVYAAQKGMSMQKVFEEFISKLK